MASARAAVNGGGWQQQIEDRAQRLLDVELRIAAPGGGEVELPTHAGDR